MISRNFYLNQLINVRGTDFIKIITGIRRCGKSTLLQLYKEYLLKNEVHDSQIIEINFERFSFADLKDGKRLHDHVAGKIKDDSQYYLFIDEIQEVPDWPQVLNSLRVSYNVDIYITGSNSRVFSGEYLTYISGRYIEIKVYPLSLAEFLAFRQDDVADIADSFEDYLRIGAFPAAALSRKEEVIESINAGLFDSIFSRDIILRGKFRDEGKFFKVAKFVFDNIGNQLSASGIANTLKSQNYKVSVDTVDNYLTLMSQAFLIYQCERFDIRGKEWLKTNGKYYVADLGLRNQLIGYRQGNIGHVIENLVYLELIRRGYKVSIGKVNSLEIDFVALKGEDRIYIQVALSALDEQVLQRELAPFDLVKDNYSKYLITMDKLNLSQNGYKHLQLLDFLLGKTDLR